MEDVAKRRGAFLVLLGALCFSTSGTAQALAPSGSTPYVIGVIRLFGGGLLLLAWLALRGQSKSVFGGERWPVLHLCLAAGGLLGFQILFFAAVARVGVAVGTVTAIGISPVCAGVLGLLILREVPAARWYPATAVAIAGLAALAMPGHSDFDTWGMLMAAGAGCSYSFFQISGKPLVLQRPPEAVMAAVSCLGGLCMLPWLFLHHETLPVSWVWQSPAGLLVALHLALVTSALAFSLYLAGLRRTPAALAATLGLAEPLGAALIGITFLHEPLTGRTMLGMGLLFCSMVILLLPQRK